MSKRSFPAIAGVALAALLSTPSSAMASTEMGNHCTGNISFPGATIIGTANASGGLPATAPSSGVITRWTFSVVPIPSGVLSQTLKVFRPTGVPNQFQVVGESGFAPISSGLNTFSTRIPVHAGDYLGTYGVVTSAEPVTVYCNTGNEGDRGGAIVGNPAPGSNATVVEEASKIQVPITAVIEPDADNDGYGDETQDKCPQSASTQGECPTITLDLSSPIKKKGSVVVSVTATSETPVTVGGVAKLGKGKKAKLSGGTHTVKPGKITRFTLKFTKKLKAALADLPKGKSLSLKITASAKDLIGRVTKDQLKVKLKGQA